MTNGSIGQLLASIADGRLVLICGAGLSFAPPSSVPSATELARSCARKFTLETNQPVPEGAGNNLERLSEFLWQTPPYWALFVDRLIEWERFKGEPNRGHLTIADFLSCSAAFAAITTNFDPLIEKGAERHGEPDFQAATTGGEMNRDYPHRPLLKLHGCMVRDRNLTVWCHSQINGDNRNATLVANLESCKRWLQGNLRGRDLLLVGFWSDWAYLHSILVDSVRGSQPAAIFLVDPATEEQLRDKAPGLWEFRHSPGLVFTHIRASGADFLDELRRQFALRFFANVMDQARPTFDRLSGEAETPAVTLPTTLSSDELYELRRDLCGVPPRKVVRDKRPAETMHLAGAVHLMLQARGLIFSGPRYATADGQTIRVVNGAGKVLSKVKDEFSKHQPQTAHGEIVICLAEDDGNAPADVVRGDIPADVIRSGSGAEWIVYAEARARGLLG